MDWNLVKGRGSSKYCQGLHALNWVHSALQANIDMFFTDNFFNSCDGLRRM